MLRDLHRGECFVIPNPWDVGSARLLEGLGFQALATTSAGLAQSLGKRDQEVTLDELVDPMRFTEQTTNMPRVWARDGDSYVLRPIPDDTYAVRERVYEYPSSLSGDSSTNFATLYLPKLVEIAATRYGYMYYGEAESFQLWSQLYSAELAKAVGVDRRRLSPSRPTMKPGTGAGALESGYPSGYGSSYAPYSWL